jgi:hypothetical protein
VGDGKGGLFLTESGFLPASGRQPPGLSSSHSSHLCPHTYRGWARVYRVLRLHQKNWWYRSHIHHTDAEPSGDPGSHTVPSDRPSTFCSGHHGHEELLAISSPAGGRLYMGRYCFAGYQATTANSELRVDSQPERLLMPSSKNGL